MHDSYFTLINSRKYDPRYEGRKVIIDYSFDRDKVIYKVIDQGEGFDTAAILASNQETLNNEGALHGRGISMSKQIFDRIKYNRKGNQVLLVKYFNAL